MLCLFESAPPCHPFSEYLRKFQNSFQGIALVMEIAYKLKLKHFGPKFITCVSSDGSQPPELVQLTLPTLNSSLIFSVQNSQNLMYFNRI